MHYAGIITRGILLYDYNDVRIVLIIDIRLRTSAAVIGRHDIGII